MTYILTASIRFPADFPGIQSARLGLPVTTGRMFSMTKTQMSVMPTAAAVLRPLAEKHPKNGALLNNLAWYLRESAPREALAVANQAGKFARPGDVRPLTDHHEVRFGAQRQRQRARGVE